jgi:hypothetical protein
MYRVFWSPEAEAALEAILTAATEPALLAAAARTLDRRLAVSGPKFGESRHETMRVGFVLPLGIQFEIMEDVNTIIVHDLWRIDRGKDPS